MDWDNVKVILSKNKTYWHLIREVVKIGKQAERTLKDDGRENMLDDFRDAVLRLSDNRGHDCRAAPGKSRPL